MKETNRETFAADVLASNGQVLVFFNRPVGCPACAAAKPLVERYAEENPDVTVLDFPLDGKENEVAAQYAPRVPTLVAFEDGKMQRSTVAPIDEKKLSRAFVPTQEAKIMAMGKTELQAYIFNTARQMQDAQKFFEFASKHLAQIEEDEAYENSVPAMVKRAAKKR